MMGLRDLLDTQIKTGGGGHKLMHIYLDTHNIHAYTYFDFEGEFSYMYVCMYLHLHSHMEPG